MKKRLLAFLLLITLLIGEMPAKTYAYEGTENLPILEEKNDPELEMHTIDGSEYILQSGGFLSAEMEDGISVAANIENENDELTYDGLELDREDVDAFYASQADYEGAKNAIITALRSFSDTCELSQYHISVEDIWDLYYNILNSHPEFFYVSSRLSYESDENDICSEIYAIYLYDKETASEMVNTYNEKMAEILSNTSDSWSDLEKLLFINDYLCRNCEYDLSYSHYNAYDCLVEGSAVCQGYTLAFLALCNELGVECNLVTSDELFHAWNMVKMNGNYYFVDSTWNDPIPDRFGQASHLYFLKSNSVFQDPNRKEYHASSDWVVRGGWKKEYCKDTHYDDYFWKNLYAGFEWSYVKI